MTYHHVYINVVVARTASRRRYPMGTDPKKPLFFSPFAGTVPKYLRQLNALFVFAKEADAVLTRWQAVIPF